MNDEEPKTRSGAERIRLEGSIRQLRGILDGVETALKLGGPVGTDVAQAVITGASSVALQLARHDAYDMYEQDMKNRAKQRPEPCGTTFLDVGPGVKNPRKETCTPGKLCPSCFASLSQWEGAQKQRPF